MYDGSHTSLQREMDRNRYCVRQRNLRAFTKQPEYWELLLLLAELDGDPTCGIESCLDQLQTLQVSRITIRNFIKDRMADGSFISQVGHKKSSRKLLLHPDLRADLEAYLKKFVEPGLDSE